MSNPISLTTQRILDAYDIRSRHSETEPKALAAALRSLIKEHQEYADDGCGPFVVYCYDIWNIIEELEEADEEITEEENERRFKKCIEWIENITREEIIEAMGEEFLEEFRRVSQR